MEKLPNKKEDKVDYLKYYVKPHRKKAREVKTKDIKRVVEDANIMFNLCYTPRGLYPSAFAIAHSQINDKDPLSFFVLNDQKIIINPVITRHTKVPVDSEEGCLSLPDMKPIVVPSYHKCEVEYQTLELDGKPKKGEEQKFKLSEKIEDNISGMTSKVFQHEQQHLLGENIYDN